MAEEDLLDRLSEQFPEERPIRPSVYTPGCLIGQTKVWKDGKETITDTDGLYPLGSIPLYSRQSSSSHEDAPFAARVWLAVSRAIMTTVGLGSKFILSGMNTTIIHGREHLEGCLNRPLHVPMVSVFNHNSCFDDPGLMGALLTPAQLRDYKGMRWSCSGTEVVFLNRWISAYWALGKVVPITRGWGPNQPAIDFLLKRLNEGSWVNIFPQAKVYDNPSQRLPYYKWGAGRLIMESEISPIVLPVYHIGMNTILPNPKRPFVDNQPVLIRQNKLVTVCVGEPLDFATERAELNAVEPQEAWAIITRKIERSMVELEERARCLHRTNFINWCKRWHDNRDVYPYLLT